MLKVQVQAMAIVFFFKVWFFHILLLIIVNPFHVEQSELKIKSKCISLPKTRKVTKISCPYWL